MQALSVATLNEQIKYTLESTFLQVAVEGEISRPTYHGSGHVYFALKDSDATIKAVMFRGNASKLKFRLEEGLKVIVYGAITVYKPRGEYQLNISSVEPAGVGNLALAFNQLKEKLSKQGYFEQSSKKQKPRLVGSLAIIASATSAALQDMIRVTSKRWPMVELTLIDVLVQGDKASSQIVQAIRKADTLNVDAIVLARGGGSVEDLWCFNEETIAHALFECQTFCVSAIGHEIDWVISDYVADLRAATPSASMELLLSDQWELRQYIDQQVDQANLQMKKMFMHKSEQLTAIKQHFQSVSIVKRFERIQEEINGLKEEYNRTLQTVITYHMQSVKTLFAQLSNSMAMRITGYSSDLSYIKKAFEQANPAHKDKKGFVQVSSDKKIVQLENVKVGDRLDLTTSKQIAQVEVKATRKL